MSAIAFVLMLSLRAFTMAAFTSSSPPPFLSPSGKVQATALFIHGFKYWHNDEAAPRARLHRISSDAAFGSLPQEFAASYALEYSTATPFASTVDAAYRAIYDAGLHPSRLVLHGHSCGGLLIASILEKAAREKGEGPPIAVFTYDSPFGGLHSLVAKVIKESSGVSAGSAGAGTDSSSSRFKLFTDPIGFAIQQVGGRFGLLDRAKMTSGQLSFLEPILGGQSHPGLVKMRKTLLDAHATNGGHVYAASWAHPSDLHELQEAQDEAQRRSGGSSGGPPSSSLPRRSISGGFLSPDVESVFLSLLPPYMFSRAPEPEWAALEWPWHVEASRGTALDHIAGHGRGQMFTAAKVKQVKEKTLDALAFRAEQEEAVAAAAAATARRGRGGAGTQPGSAATAAATSKQAAAGSRSSVAIDSSGRFVEKAAKEDVVER